ncbi:hypothetical protein N9H78_00830 [Winogradskyella sp.]|nr:hypothetical protein [Winogradskyella sp.]MDA8874199.1 hypothetical protein [Winogradskyella sp.]
MNLKQALIYYKIRLIGQGKGVTILKMHKDINPEEKNNAANIILIQPSILISDFSEKANIEIKDMSLDFDIHQILENGKYKKEWQFRVDKTAKDNVGNCITGRGNNNNDAYLEDIYIHNIEVKNAAFHGIALYELSRRIKIEKVEASDCLYRAIHVHGAEGSKTVEELYIVGNKSQNSGINGGGYGNGGIFAFFHNAKVAHILSNIVLDDKGVGIHCWGVGNINQIKSNSVIVSNNIVERCGAGYLLGSGIDGMVVEGNIARDNRNDKRGGVRHAKGRAFTISGIKSNIGVIFNDNLAQNNDGAALSIDNLNSFSLSNNVFVGNNKYNESYTMSINNSKNGVISGNMLSNNNQQQNFSYFNDVIISATKQSSTNDLFFTNNMIVSNNQNSPVFRFLGKKIEPFCTDITIMGNRFKLNKSNNFVTIELMFKESAFINNRYLGKIKIDFSENNIIKDNIQQ